MTRMVDQILIALNGTVGFDIVVPHYHDCSWLVCDMGIIQLKSSFVFSGVL